MSKSVINDYLSHRSEDEKENASNLYSVGGLNAAISAGPIRDYWLDEVYPSKVAEWHRSGRVHVHDLSSGFKPYCLGLDFEALLRYGFGGVEGQPSSKPPRHMRTAVDQLVNWFGVLSQEAAGALAISNFDVYMAPFVREDGMTDTEIRRCCESLVYAVNVVSRFGGLSMFTNVNVSGRVPGAMRDLPAVLGGEYPGTTYGEYEEETERVALALLDVLYQGQPDGKPWTFPIISVGITDGYDWGTPFARKLCRLAARYGTPNFLNYGSRSPYSEEDTLASCCRLATDTSVLRSSGGLFSVNPNTGSIGVITVSLPYLAAQANGSRDLFLWRLRETVLTSIRGLKYKRDFLERNLERGLYPYWKAWVGDFKNHFSTIGLIGGDEAVRILAGGNTRAHDPWGQDLLRAALGEALRACEIGSEETGQLVNLEEVPGEGACYSLAKRLVAEFPWTADLFEGVPYLTNGVKPHVSADLELGDWIAHASKFQSRYTGGSALHHYLPGDVTPGEVVQEVRAVMANTDIPHYTVNPRYSVCEEHGRVPGHADSCPQCGGPVLKAVRVLGYVRYVTSLNPGKDAEYRERRYL